MYRARVEAVSGTKIFAGGKWLRCIGNKCVSVGDQIWTDGRCVYGDYYTPQQPLIITAPQEDEAIPIYMVREDEDPRRFKFYLERYNYIKGIKKIDSSETNLKYNEAQRSLMINDFKGNVFFYDGTPLTISEDENFSVKERLIAINIDKAGNIFDIILRYNADNHDMVEYETVEIRKNGSVLQTFNLQNFYSENIFDECPAPPPYPFLMGMTKDLSVYSAFIEDENTWRFFVSGLCEKWLSDEYTGPYSGSGSDPASGTWTRYHDSYSLLKIYQFTAAGNQLLYERSVSSELGVKSRSELYPDLSETKLILPDGFHCKMRNVDLIPDAPIAVGLDFYNEDSKKIFSMENLSTVYPYLVLTEDFCLALAHVGSGYLLSVRGYLLANGIYSIKNGKARELLSAYRVLNQRLRPMKKYKHWHKHVQEITDW